MRNILLTVEYDGSSFHGWQEQPGQRTVQGVIQDAISQVLSQPIKVNGTSRTDAGVHALGQCCNFTGEFSIPTENIMKAVNNVLSEGRVSAGTKPGDVRIIEVKEMPEGFHPRFDCKKKTYKYVINTGEANVFRRNYCYFVDGELDLDSMRSAAKVIEGTHDFACFQAAGGNPRETTVRTIYSIEIDKSGEDIEISVTGDGFLYNMVRIIVGTLVEVGLGKRDSKSVKETVDSCDRTKAGHTAPAEGLYLAKIYFD